MDLNLVKSKKVKKNFDLIKFLYVQIFASFIPNSIESNSYYEELKDDTLNEELNANRKNLLKNNQEKFKEF